MPSVALDADGDFVVAWESYGFQDFHQDGSSGGIFARRFSAAGSPLATEFQVNTYTTNNQYDPSVALDDDGGFVVTWSSNGQDRGLFGGIFARRFSAAGSPVAAEFQVNAYTIGTQRLPSVALDADGDFVVAWGTSGGMDPDSGDLRAPLHLVRRGSGCRIPGQHLHDV